MLSPALVTAFTDYKGSALSSLYNPVSLSQNRDIPLGEVLVHVTILFVLMFHNRMNAMTGDFRLIIDSIFSICFSANPSICLQNTRNTKPVACDTF